MAKTPEFIERYQVIRRLGHGGMGDVYLAYDPRLDREVAIKLLRDGLDNGELRERFNREAQAVSRLSGHANIVTVFDVGEFDSQPFIAMEYVPGETLATIIRNATPLSLVQQLGYIDDLCAGLNQAHQTAIIHRDIKPSNLMVTPQGILKILDFGIARRSDSSMTRSGAMVGTLNYMSPEQLKGDPVDLRSDIFAVGAVAYEVLSFRQAFPGTLQDGLLYKVLASGPTPLAELCPTLDPRLVRLIEWTLEKERDRRPPDLNTVRRELAAIRSSAEAAATDATIVLDRGEAPGRATRGATPRRGTDRELIAKRRLAEIAQQLETARECLRSGNYEGAIAAGEGALLLDAENDAAIQILEQARAALDERRSHACLEEAQRRIAQHDLTAASGLLAEARSLHPGVHGHTIAERIESLQQEIDDARRRTAMIDATLARARTLFDEGELTGSLAAVDQVLTFDQINGAGGTLRAAVLAAIEARDVERARALVDSAVRLFAAGDHEQAIGMLASVARPHDVVLRALADLRTQRDAAERERRAEEERRAQQRADEARRAAEQRARALQALVADGARHLKEGALDRAEDAARQAAALDPDGDLARDFAARVARAIESRQRAAEKAAAAAAARELKKTKAAARTVPHGKTERSSRLRIGAALTAAVVVVAVSVGVWLSRRSVVPPAPSTVVEKNNDQPTRKDTPAPPPTTVDPGLLNVDAMPWAEVTAVLDAKGNNRAANKNWVTPLGLPLEPGRYTVTLKDSSSSAVKNFDIEIVSGKTARTSYEFRRVSADEYFRNAGFQVGQ